MDDYNVNVLSEAKNEYSSRLLNILTPLIILGIKSIFNEAVDLCIDNNEEEKYLMTFQNFLSRVPKWNSNIIKEEKNRIIEESKCPYLEDLLTCVHITQLKILTSIRVSNQQKKIEIDIPKLDEFIHKVYIEFARKLYSNIYLFEKDIMPLSYQKNMREAEILCRECILKVLRDSMPIEQILRAYMDEAIHDEIVEETLEKQITEDEAIDMIEEAKKNNENSEKDIEINKIGTVEKDNEITVEEPKLLENNQIANEAIKEATDSIKEDSLNNVEEKLASVEKKLETLVNNDKTAEENKETVKTPVIESSLIKTPVTKQTLVDEERKTIIDKIPKNDAIPIAPISSPRSNISFSDSDQILDMGTNKKSTVHAPKTQERLDEISRLSNIKRKEEEANYDDDDDDDDFNDDGPLKISSNNISLDIMDIQDVSKDLKINKNPILGDIEVLA
jgi:hypothetical protein